MRLLALDPGISTGWALLDTEQYPPLVKFGTEKPIEKFFELLTTVSWTSLDIVVTEDYKVRPQGLQRGFSHEWNSVPAAQVIGAIKFWCYDNDIKLVIQQPAIKPQGYSLLGEQFKKGKTKEHHIDAIAHGVYYLVKNKILTRSDLTKRAV